MISIIELVAYKQRQGEMWRCMECLLEGDEAFILIDMIQHLSVFHQTNLRDLDVGEEVGTIYKSIKSLKSKKEEQ